MYLNLTFNNSFGCHVGQQLYTTKIVSTLEGLLK